MTGAETPTHKQVEVAIRVNVRERHGAGARFARGDAFDGHARYRVHLDLALSFLRHLII